MTLRDVLAGVIALALLGAAASLATTLQYYRRRRQGARDVERARGRAIIAEIPSEDDLVLFSEDQTRFYYGERSIDKESINAVRMLINDAAIASCASRSRAVQQPGPGGGQVEHAGVAENAGGNDGGIARDRWDVAIETDAGTTLVACGAIRERVSQDLARAVFEAVKRDLERRDLT
jgi:hypothetical protein